MNKSNSTMSNLNGQPYENETKTIIKLKSLLADLDNPDILDRNKISAICEEMQKLVLKKLNNVSYQLPYLLLLIQIYAIKLQQFWKAEKLCNIILKNCNLRDEAHVQALLRLSYVSSLKRQYMKAIERIDSAYSMTKKNPQLQHTILKYFEKIFTNSIDTRLINGLNSIDLQNYQTAIDYFSEEFTLTKDEDSSNLENKFFAAQSILQLFKLFPEESFSGTTAEECDVFLKNLENEGVFDNDVGVSAYDRYIYKKKYLQAIIKYNNRSQKNIENPKIQQYYAPYYSLAKNKLKKCINQKALRDEQSLRILEFIHDELLQKNPVNICPILDFVNHEYQIMNKIPKIGKRIEKDSVQNAFHQLYRYSQFKKNYLKQAQQHPHEQSNFFIQDQLDELFIGSNMYKINLKSNGGEQRYFHFDPKQRQNNIFRLYFCADESKVSNKNSYYDVTGAKLILGKTTRAHNRKQFKKFSKKHCFTLMTLQKEINFYVPNIADYHNWELLFQDNLQKLEKARQKSKKKIRIKENSLFHRQ